MNPSSLYEMRHSIVQAVSDYVDIEAEELVEVRAAPTEHTLAMPAQCASWQQPWHGMLCHESIQDGSHFLQRVYSLPSARKVAVLYLWLSGHGINGNVWR